MRLTRSKYKAHKADGLSNADIARKYGITPPAIAYYLKRWRELEDQEEKPMIHVPIDEPVRKFLEMHPTKKERLPDFIQLMMEGERYCDIADQLELKETYVQNAVSKYMLQHDMNRFTMMSKIYQIARDERVNQSTGYVVPRPDGVE